VRQRLSGRKHGGASAEDRAGHAGCGCGDGFVGTVVGAQLRERERLVAEVVRFRTLVPLLMKRRDGGSWTRQDRVALRGQLRAMAHLSPYLLLLILPGSFALLPILAWWLDRRHGRCEADRRAVSGLT